MQNLLYSAVRWGGDDVKAVSKRTYKPLYIQGMDRKTAGLTDMPLLLWPLQPLHEKPVRPIRAQSPFSHRPARSTRS